MPFDQDYFRTRFRYDVRRDAVWKEVSTHLHRRHIRLDARILELGAGYCHWINHLTGKEKHALDTSEIIVRHAAPGVTVHVGPCSDLSIFSAGSMDVICASNLFEHLTAEELCHTLREVFRVLANRGKLIVIQPNFRYCYREYFDDYTHVQIFTDRGLSDRLVSEGFQIVEIQPRFLPFSMRSRLPKSQLLVKLYLALPYRPFAGQMLLVAEKTAASKD